MIEQKIDDNQIKNVLNSIFDGILGSQNKENDIIYEGDPDYLTDRTSFINDWIGHKSEMPYSDLINGTDEKTNEDIKNLMSINEKLPRSIEEEIRKEEYGYINDSVHANYWRAYMRNLKYTALFSRNRIGVSFSKVFKIIEPLDVVYYEDPDTIKKSLSNKYTSGTYLVTRNVVTVENRNIRNYSELSRESMNYLEGDLY